MNFFLIEKPNANAPLLCLVNDSVAQYRRYECRSSSTSQPRDDLHARIAGLLPTDNLSPPAEPPRRNQTTSSTTANLDVGIVSLGRETLDVLEIDGVRLTRALGQSLELDGLALGLGVLFPLGVGLDAGQELLAGAGVVDVLQTDVEALLHVAVADLLVDDDTDGGAGDVVDDTSLSVVDLVGHTLLLGTVVLDVYDVADLVLFPVLGGLVRMGSFWYVSEMPFSEAGEAHMKVLRRTMPFWRCLRENLRWLLVRLARYFVGLVDLRISRSGSETGGVTHFDEMLRLNEVREEKGELCRADVELSSHIEVARRCSDSVGNSAWQMN